MQQQRRAQRQGAHRVHRAPPLCCRLLGVHGVDAGGVQDGDAHLAVREHCSAGGKDGGR